MTRQGQQSVAILGIAALLFFCRSALAASGFSYERVVPFGTPLRWEFAITNDCAWPVPFKTAFHVDSIQYNGMVLSPVASSVTTNLVRASSVTNVSFEVPCDLYRSHAAVSESFRCSASVRALTDGSSRLLKIVRSSVSSSETLPVFVLPDVGEPRHSLVVQSCWTNSFSFPATVRMAMSCTTEFETPDGGWHVDWPATNLPPGSSLHVSTTVVARAVGQGRIFFSLSSDQFPRISGFWETNVTERMRTTLSFDQSRAEIPSLKLLDERGNVAVSALLAETATMLDSPEGTNAVQSLIRLISPYDSPDMRGFRPMECEMQIRCFIETNKFGNAAYLGNVLARLDRFSPEVQRDIFYTFSDLLIDPFLFDSDSEERKEETIRAFSLDIIPLLWSIARNANVSAEVRRWAWIHVGAAVQRGDPSAAPFAAGLKAADEAIAEAERETERERRLRTEAPPPTPPRTNAEPIPVGVKVRRARTPATSTNAPPGFSPHEISRGME